MQHEFRTLFHALARQLPLIVLMLLVPALGHAAPCPWVVSPQASQQLYDKLRAIELLMRFRGMLKDRNTGGAAAVEYPQDVEGSEY